MKKPKVNRKASTDESAVFDRCQTPAYALDPILPYLPVGSRLWEPACGDGHIVTTLTHAGHTVIGTDLLYGENFFHLFQPCDVLVTNPPYGIKYEWLERCLHLHNPFALLVPWDTLAAASCWDAFEVRGREAEVIVMTPRISFKMPNVGYGGKGAQFSTCWVTHGLGIGKQIQRVKVAYRPDPWDTGEVDLITRRTDLSLLPRALQTRMELAA